MLLFSQDSLGTVSSCAEPDCFGSRMKRRTGSPGGWVPVAATIEYERPDLVRLKLWSKAPVVPFEERSWSGWLGEDMISVKIREEKSAWKPSRKQDVGSNICLQIFEYHALLPTGSKLRSVCLPIL